MDQPTNLELKITGKSEDVKRAALLAQKRIESLTIGFEEGNYEYDCNTDFKSKMNDVIGIMGDFTYIENSDGTAEYTTVQDSYGCADPYEVSDILADIMNGTPNVEVHIEAVIPMDEEDCDCCVNLDYTDGEPKVSVYKDIHDDFDDAEEEDIMW